MNVLKARNYAQQRFANIDSLLVGKRYYRNMADIKNTGVVPKGSKSACILRNADNRISQSFHSDLVDEKTGYLFTYPPLINVDDNDTLNEKVMDRLGEDYGKKMADLCVEASNCGTSWVHVWADEEGFKWDKMETEQIIPFYSNDLSKKLIEVLRVYKIVETDDNLTEKIYVVVEDWTVDTFDRYVFENDLYGDEVGTDKGIRHNFGRVPFIEFKNNSLRLSDLNKYKDQIDLYNRVASGFGNDIEDMQEVLWIITNYGGDTSEESVTNFLDNTKKYKTVFLEDDGDAGKGAVDTLSVDIPVDARETLLSRLEKAIYEIGQGLPKDVEFGNVSGVALKFLYRRLELKAGLLETQFRSGLSELVKTMLEFYNIPYKTVNQIWTRNMISNDIEASQIAQQSVGILPTKVILQNHPWVDDVEATLKLLDEEEKEKQEMFNSYNNVSFNNPKNKEVEIDEE